MSTLVKLTPEQHGRLAAHVCLCSPVAVENAFVRKAVPTLGTHAGTAPS